VTLGDESDEESFANTDTDAGLKGPVPRPSLSLKKGTVIRLRRDLRVNLAGVAVILEMRQHIEELQKDLERLWQSAGVL
jgi:hypothetical protein